MPHQQKALYLLQGIQHHPDHDQNGRPPKKLCKLIGNANGSHDRRQNRYASQRQRPR
jgi:hypothetical protein